MNATDERDYIVQGFKDIILDVQERLLAPIVPNVIRANTEARERAQARVKAEYAAYGLEAPSEWALSITARRAMALVDQERNRETPIDQPSSEVAA